MSENLRGGNFFDSHCSYSSYTNRVR